MKKVISILLAVLLIVSMVSVALISAGAEEAGTEPTEQTVWFKNSPFNKTDWEGDTTYLSEAGSLLPTSDNKATLTTVAEYNLGNSWHASMLFGNTHGSNHYGNPFRLIIGGLEARVYDRTGTTGYKIEVLKDGVSLKTVEFGTTPIKLRSTLDLEYINGMVYVYCLNYSFSVEVGEMDFSAVKPSVYCQASWMNGHTFIYSFTLMTTEIKGANTFVSGAFDSKLWTPAELIANGTWSYKNDDLPRYANSLYRYNLGKIWDIDIDLTFPSYNRSGQKIDLSINNITASVYNISADGATDGYFELLVDGTSVGSEELGSAVSGNLKISYANGVITAIHTNKSNVVNEIVFDATSLDLSFDAAKFNIGCNKGYAITTVSAFSVLVPKDLDEPISGALVSDMWTPSNNITNGQIDLTGYGYEKAITSVDKYALGTRWIARIGFRTTSTNEGKQSAVLKIGDVEVNTTLYDKNDTATTSSVNLLINGESKKTVDYGRNAFNGTLYLEYIEHIIKVKFISSDGSEKVSFSYDATADGLNFDWTTLHLSHDGNWVTNGQHNYINRFDLSLDHTDKYDDNEIVNAGVNYVYAGGFYESQWDSTTLRDGMCLRDVVDGDAVKYSTGAIKMPTNTKSVFRLTYKNPIYTDEYIKLTYKGDTFGGRDRYVGITLGTVRILLGPDGNGTTLGADSVTSVNMYLYYRGELVSTVETGVSVYDWANHKWSFTYDHGIVTVTRDGTQFGDTFDYSTVEGWDPSDKISGTVPVVEIGNDYQVWTVYDFSIEAKANASFVYELENLAKTDIAAAKNLYESLSASLDEYFLNESTAAVLTPDASIVGENATVVITSPIAPIYGEEVTASVTVDEGMTFDGVYDADGNYLTNETVFTGVMLPSTKITAKAALAVFDKFNLSLGEDMITNFYIRSMRDDLKIRFKLDGTKPNQKTVELDDTYVGEANYYKYSYNGVAPQNMGETITAEILDGNNVVATKQIVVADYLKALKSDEYKGIVMTSSIIGSSETKYNTMVTLVNDLLCYGGAAQTYLGDKYQGTAIDLTNVTGTEYVALDKTTTHFGGKPENGVNWKSGNVLHDSVNKIIIRFTLGADANINDYTFKYKIGEGEEIEVTPVLEDAAKGIYAITTEGVFATKFDDKYTFTAYYAESGDFAAGLTYSVRSYVISKQNNESVIGLKELVRALWNYGESAKAFVAAV